MPVNVIDTLKPKNGLSFPIVEAIDVFVDGFDNLADAVSHFATDVMIEAINAVLSDKANASDVNTAVANLQGQINQIVISSSAEAVVAPEVAAARVGDDGTEYDTLKERLDADYEDAQNQIIKISTALSRETINLFDILGNFDTANGASVSVDYDSDIITITATQTKSYVYASTYIDVRTLSNITIDWAEATGTGAASIRLGQSSDGQTFEWIDYASHKMTVDVSAYNYLVVALYAGNNCTAGQYISYSKVQVESGTTASAYEKHVTAYDGYAEEQLKRINIDQLMYTIEPSDIEVGTWANNVKSSTNKRLRAKTRIAVKPGDHLICKSSNLMLAYLVFENAESTTPLYESGYISCTNGLNIEIGYTGVATISFKTDPEQVMTVDDYTVKVSLWYNYEPVIVDNDFSDISTHPLENRIVTERFETTESKIDALTEKTRNLFNPNNDYELENGATVSVSKNTVRITSTQNKAYAGAAQYIDARLIDRAVISWVGTSGTGSPKVRLGWSNDGVTHGGWIGFVDNGNSYDVSSYNYIRIMLYSAYNAADAGTYVDYIGLMVESGNSPSKFIPYKSAKDYDAWNEIGIYSGNLAYTGEKVIIDRYDAQHFCNINLWKDFVNVSEYTYLHKNQSMAIYGGFVFLFQSDGEDVVVLDYSTKEIVSTFGITPTTSIHANSAQFTGIFYSDNDEFPLLAVSRSGLSTPYDELLIYRITRSGTEFEAELINTIKADTTSYGISWGIDSNAKTITSVCYTNGSYLVTENNPIKFFTWRLPHKADIISGQAITLSLEDAIAQYEIDHMTFQGVCAYGGKIYTGLIATGYNESVWVVDVQRGIVLSKIKLVSTYEVEGVSIYNGMLYVSQRNDSDTTGDNPLKIYELRFD